MRDLARELERLCQARALERAGVNRFRLIDRGLIPRWVFDEIAGLSSRTLEVNGEVVERELFLVFEPAGLN